MCVEEGDGVVEALGQMPEVLADLLRRPVIPLPNVKGHQPLDRLRQLQAVWDLLAEHTRPGIGLRHLYRGLALGGDEGGTQGHVDCKSVLGAF